MYNVTKWPESLLNTGLVLSVSANYERLSTIRAIIRFNDMAAQNVNQGIFPGRTYAAAVNLQLIIACILMAGCASYSEPIIDTQGVNMSQYETDLADCKAYSEQVDPAAGMTKGAAAGAATGAAIGAISSGRDVGESAGVGAVLGASKSGVRAADDADKVVKQCLRYRGYRVLN